MDAGKKHQIILTGCIIGWMLLSARTAALSPSLTADTLLEGSTVCPNQTVVFTCHTTGPVAWSSVEYIGGGGRQLTFGLDDIVGSIRRSIISDSIYAQLLSIDHGNRIITSIFRIMASSNSLVNCTATDDNQNHSTINIRIPDKPGVPEDLVANQIRDTRYELCFIPVVWKNSANSIEAQVTHYTVNINQYFMSNQAANHSSAAYSILFATECTENHTLSVDISATNVCGITGLRTVYRTQGQDPKCPKDINTSHCDAEIPTQDTSVQPTDVGAESTDVGAESTDVGAESTSASACGQSHGSILLLIGTVVTTTSYLLAWII